MINRGRESKLTIALDGGNLDLVAFHVTPPLGSSMLVFSFRPVCFCLKQQPEEREIS
jgi:hypothetical protein